MMRRQIYVGDYVRLNESYFEDWSAERDVRLRELRETIFLVTSADRCWNWSYGVRGGGMLLTLTPFTGPLVQDNVTLGRGDSSLELVDPEYVDRVLAKTMEEEEQVNGIGTI